MIVPLLQNVHHSLSRGWLRVGDSFILQPAWSESRGKRMLLRRIIKTPTIVPFTTPILYTSHSTTSGSGQFRWYAPREHLISSSKLLKIEEIAKTFPPPLVHCSLLPLSHPVPQRVSIHLLQRGRILHTTSTNSAIIENANAVTSRCTGMSRFMFSWAEHWTLGKSFIRLVVPFVQWYPRDAAKPKYKIKSAPLLTHRARRIINYISFCSTPGITIRWFGRLFECCRNCFGAPGFTARRKQSTKPMQSFRCFCLLVEMIKSGRAS